MNGIGHINEKWWSVFEKSTPECSVVFRSFPEFSGVSGDSKECTQVTPWVVVNHRAIYRCTPVKIISSSRLQEFVTTLYRLSLIPNECRPQSSSCLSVLDNFRKTGMDGFSNNKKISIQNSARACGDFWHPSFLARPPRREKIVLWSIRSFRSSLPELDSGVGFRRSKIFLPLEVTAWNSLTRRVGMQRTILDQTLSVSTKLCWIKVWFELILDLNLKFQILTDPSQSLGRHRRSCVTDIQRLPDGLKLQLWLVCLFCYLK